MNVHHSLNRPQASIRECGGCTVCCRIPKITELKKPAGLLCQHCNENVGCGIYETRPSVCREFHCGWKELLYLGDEWRPDKSGILICLVGEGEDIPAAFPQLGLKFDVESPRVLNWFPLIALIAKEIQRGMPVFLGTPSPVGYDRRKVLLNPLMANAVASRDRTLMAQALKRAFEIGLSDALKEKTTFD